MDINTLRGLSTVFVMIAFLGVCWWAYSPKRKSQFDQAAQLPFADDAEKDETTKAETGLGDDLSVKAKSSTKDERQSTL